MENNIHDFIERQLLSVKPCVLFFIFNNGSNVRPTIICEKGVGKPTQACLILKTSVSNVDDSCKACKLTSI